MFEAKDLKEFQPPARVAIENASGRLERAVEAKDVEGIVGASKELVETVGKAVVDALGGTYGSDVKVHKLAKQTLELLGLHPSGLQDRESLKRLTSAQVSTVMAVAELRNSDGTGHGRAAPSDLDIAHATLAREAAVSWSAWTIAAAKRVLHGRAAHEEALTDLAGGRVFYRNEIPRFLDELQLSTLADEDQRRVGLAAGRRWNVGGTFLMLEDMIQPLATGAKVYPPAFSEGVLEGLILDHNGYLRTSAENASLAVQIANRLPAEGRGHVLQELANRVEESLLSQSFGDQERNEAIAELRRLAEAQADPASLDALVRIADHIELLGHVAAEWDDEDEYEEL
jgi:hypothetical protein